MPHPPEEHAANVQAVEAQLAALEGTFADFCARHGYTFVRVVGVWPRRRAWWRGKVDRCFDLTMDWTVPEFMERGYSPDMPWSLHVTASFPDRDAQQARLLTAEVFRGLPLSALNDRLGAALEEGLATLQTLTP